MLAALVQEPTLALDKEEAKQLAIAANSVASHYDLETSAKTTAWAHLLVVAGMAYIPRGIILVRKHRKDPQTDTPKNFFGANVVSVNSQG